MFRLLSSRQPGSGRLLSLGRRLVTELLPGRCSVCGRVQHPEHGNCFLCSGCLNLLQPRTRGYCPSCARIYADKSSLHTCQQCRTSPFSWSSISFYSIYEGLLKELILRYKFTGQLGLGAVLADLLFQSVQDVAHLLDCVVPVPLHEKRLRHRGFNQCLELSLILGGRLNLPVFRQAVVKTRHTPPQSSVGRSSRLRNLKGVFRTEPGYVEGKRILLVDDIMTTGATLEECTRTLLKARVRQVHAAFLARVV
ncbi:MAG: phosphoribosyltransferase family protein [Desulfonatronovibrionaceae bacterium]